MNRHRFASLIAVWSLVAVPAFAGQHGSRAPQGGHGGQGGAPGARAEGHAVPRGPVAAPPRTVPPPPQVTPRAYPPQVARQVVQPRIIGPRAVPRGFPPQVVAPRDSRPEFNSRSYTQPRFYRPGIVQPRIVTVHPFYRPYYAFRPRFSLGFGLWVGYPVVYPYYYYSTAYPLPYAVPYPVVPYPAPPAAPLAPGSIAPTATGGLSFDITPSDAMVYVDGQYVGIVGQFTPNDQPLALAPGRHRVELRANGFQTIAFDVDIVAGQVIPYQGEMQPF